MSGLQLYFKKILTKIPFLLPSLPVIFFFCHNLTIFRELLFTTSVLLLFLIYLLSSFAGYLLLKKIFKLTAQQAAGLSTFIVLFFLFFGLVQDLLFNIPKIRFLSNSILLLATGICGIVFLIIITKKKRFTFTGINQYILLLFHSLILFEVSSFAIKMTTGKSFENISTNMSVPVDFHIRDSVQENPDIYHIIFDCYTNRPSFNDYWSFDNDVYPYLDSAGFYTADSAISNYKTTPFSISSIFNLQYLTGVDNYLISNSSNFLVGQKVYKKNILFDFLKRRGYAFSIFSQLENKEFLTKFGFLGVDDPGNWLRNQTLERLYLSPWIAEKFLKYFHGPEQQPAGIIKSMTTFREYNKKALEHILSDCKKSSSLGHSAPVFSYTHFMIPHDPYQVDENGDFVPTAKPGGQDLNGYLKQVKYSNKIIREITGQLLKDSARKKIIIIQGDHGYRHYTNAPENQPYGALNAMFFYNKNYKNLYKKISLVNTYRVVIDNFFNGKIPLLKDSIIGANKPIVN